MLNPVWLNTFKTLVDTGHFTKAAEKLFMTQPGVSQHIRKLEEACGAQLIRREKKRFDVTKQGKLLYAYAEQLVKNEQTFLEQLLGDSPVRGQCTLACSGSVALLLYPKLLDLQLQYPELTIKLKAAPNQQILSEIKQGDIDVGIVTHVPSSAWFTVEKIAQDELCLVLPAQQKITQLELADLLQMGLVAHPDAEHYFSLYLAQCQEESFANLDFNQLPVATYINQISQILLPVSKGLGFTVLPKSAIDSFAEKHLLQVYKPTKPVIETLYKVKKKNHQLPVRYNTLDSAITDLWQNK